MVEWQFRFITLRFKALFYQKMHRLSKSGENLLVFISNKELSELNTFLDRKPMIIPLLFLKK